jgi:hypothetical protein
LPATIPAPAQAAEYSGPLLPLLFDWRNAPKEKDQFIPASINWGADTPLGAMRINIGAKSTHFSTIKSLWVDNSLCGAPIACLFRDTGFKLRIKPGEVGLFPVFTNLREFYVVGSTAQLAPTDITFFEIFNFLPPLLDQDRSTFMVPTVNNIALTAGGALTLIAAPNGGTLCACEIIAANVTGGAGGALVTVSLTDGVPNALGEGAFGVQNAGFIDSRIILHMTDIRERFIGGLNVTVAIAGTNPAAGSARVNVWTTTP